MDWTNPKTFLKILFILYDLPFYTFTLGQDWRWDILTISLFYEGSWNTIFLDVADQNLSSAEIPSIKR